MDKNDHAIEFHAVIDESAENKRFFARNPGGHVTVYTVTPAVAATFEVGGEYWVDFTKVARNG